MNLLEHNRQAWNREARGGIVWSIPASDDVIEAARRDDWRVILTPKLPVPRDWFGDIHGKDVLCLASGGGQQVPIFAAAGARVTSFDLSDEQLALDQRVADRHGLAIECLRGDMADLSPLGDRRFDLIFHAASNVFAPDVRVVWRECFRVLRPGGVLLAGFMNPAIFMFDLEEVDRTGEMVVRHSLPYSDVGSLPPAALQEKIARQELLEFSHSLDDQIGGQLAAGFVITGFYEDRWYDDSWLVARRTPVSIATRALKPR